MNSMPIYQDSLTLMNSLENYSSPKSKLTTMIQKGEIIKLRQGLYLKREDINYSKKILANNIYGPSYISFEYALAYYGLIPERVEVVTSASFNKNKHKKFLTPLGTFIYKDIPANVYPYGVTRIEEADGPFLIATKEKALCDTVSKIPNLRFIKDIAQLLFEDLRLEEDAVFALNKTELKQLCPLYKKNKLDLLCQFISQG